MPSKSKKSSKSKNSFNPDSATPSPRSNSSSYSNLNPNHTDEDDEQSLLRSLEDVSTKYPSFIGTSALICRVMDDAFGGVESRGCKIWLSESYMIGSSITPGSIVSVSLASVRKDVPDHPLSSLMDECARHYGFDGKTVNETGNHFILATVFPSCKVTKNGVRLSSTLASAMGYPSFGRIIFVYSVNLGSNDKSVLVHKCKDLHLSLVSSKSSIINKNNKTSHLDFPSENGNISSPKTPSLTKSKLSSPCSSMPTSPRHGQSRSNSFDPSLDSCNVNEILEDEIGKKLLQTCTMSLLNSRHLIYGNLVVIPILSELCLFKVVGAEKVSEHDNENNNNNNNCYYNDFERNNGLFVQSSNIYGHGNVFLVDHGTKVHLFSEKTNFDIRSEGSTGEALIDIPKLGGLSKEYLVLKDIIISSSNNTLSSMGLRPPKGVLLHGPPGTGKTSLARLCANDAGVNLFTINGPEIVSQFYGESEQALHAVFDSAIKAAPAVVFIDELDAIAPSRKEGGEELSGRIVATLLHLMDGVDRTEGLLVIAATNRPDSIDIALRRSGRFEREIEIGVPSPSQRYEILLTLLSGKEHRLLDTEIHHLAMTTHGFVGADLAALCNEAAFVCLRRCTGKIRDESLSSKLKSFSDDLKDLNFGNNLENSNLSDSELDLGSVESDQIGGNLSVSFEDFEKARVKVRPSAMREVILEVPKVSWKDVGGQQEVKMQLIEAVEWPQKHPEAFEKIGTRPPTGVLLFGPPGCSKTLLARAVASEAKLNFLAVKGPELFSKWVGESEKAVKSLFAKAQANAPSIVFFDELDGLANIRGKENDGVSVADRVMSQLLIELDGLNQRVDVTVIAATNRPDKIDAALLRPGRFDRLVYVGPPNAEDRTEIFRIHLSKMACSSDVCIEELASLSEGCTGADISLICREAAMAAIEENLDASEVRMEHLRSAIEQVQPSDVDSYKALTAKFERLVSQATPRRSTPVSIWGRGVFKYISSIISR